MRRAMWLAGIASLLVVACTGESAAPPRTDPTVPTAPPRTTTTVGADPYAIPEVIDEAYVNRVLAALDEVHGDVLRMVKETRSIPREAFDRLESIYADRDVLQLVIDGFQAAIRLGFPGFHDDPGNRHTEATRLISVGTSCVFAQVHRDYSAQSSIEDASVTTQWIALRQVAAAPFNPTPWSFVFDGFNEGVTAPSDPCLDS